MSTSATSVQLVRTDATNPDFKKLTDKLDKVLAILDGDAHPFFAQFNKADSLGQAVLAYVDGVAAGCGAIKPFENGLAEVKRMFVEPAQRHKGIAMKVLSELENIARESGYTGCILETGKKQVEALALYHKSGYHVIPNYGQYSGVEASICMKKEW